MSRASPETMSANSAYVQRLLRVVQWVVPLALFVLSTLYEFVEHRFIHNEPYDLNMSMEILLFGILGPTAIAGIIYYVRRLVTAQYQAQQDLVDLNRNLEQKVIERTVALEQRNTDLAHANAELHQLDSMKSEFVALVSHELRAPLTILNGALELALQTDEHALPQASRSTLEIMATETRRLTDFVQNILDLSRIEAGRLTVNYGPVAVQPLLEQASLVLLSQSTRRIQWELQNNLPPALADEVLLEQVIRNLVRNADKHTPSGLPICLGARVEDGNLIRISVRDNGTGVASDMQERIFDRFVRGHSFESSPPGWGLGLYLGRKMIHAQNGRIGVVSPISKCADAPGSEFYVILPVFDTLEEM